MSFPILSLLNFHDTVRGRCCTTSKFAPREVVAQLLKVNHERYEEEVRDGLHEEGTAKGTKLMKVG